MATSRAAGGFVVTSASPMAIRPASGRSSPAIRRSVVVLPAPVGPSSTTNSPSLMSRSRASTATVSPNALRTPVRRTSAMGDLTLEQRGGQGALAAGVEQDDLAGIEGEADLLADRGALGVGGAHAQPSCLGVDGHHLAGAHILDAEHLAADHAVVGEADMLGPYAQDQPA